LLTGKQRSYLKSLANNIRPVTQIGKGGITENFISQLNDVLEARELVKINILENNLLNAKETANEIALLTNSDFVQAIGNKFVLFRKSKDNPKIELPKA